MILRRREPQCAGICRPPEDRVVGLREDPQEHLVRRHARHEHDGEVAVVGDPDVGAGAHRPRRADLASLVPGHRDDERRPPHAVLPERRLVDQAREHHRAVHRGEIVGREAELSCGARVTCVDNVDRVVPPTVTSAHPRRRAGSRCHTYTPWGYIVRRERRTRGGGGTMAIDPVCGMEVEPATAPPRPGSTRASCTGSVRWAAWSRFRADPERTCPGIHPSGT